MRKMKMEACAVAQILQEL